MEQENLDSENIEKKSEEDNSRLEIVEKKSEEDKLLLDIVEKKSEEKSKPILDMFELLKIFSPGTSIRLALDDIMRAKMGALIAIDTENLLDIVEGGFKINCKFSPQRLVELAKMDGAIILSKDIRRILFANTLLIPNTIILTKETGTRHKAAERTAKQMKTITVAVSERKNKITLYYRNLKYELKETSEVLRRAAETLQILEKQRETFDDLLMNLNILEVTNLVNVSDVCGVLQRLEMIKRMSVMVKRYLVELGKEGIVVSMRLRELTKNLNKEKELLLKDYFGSKHLRVYSILDSMDFDFLIDTPNISRMLFNEIHDKEISPRGVRMLAKTNLLEKNQKVLINTFKSLDKILNADEETLLRVLKNKELVDFFNSELKEIKEKMITGKKI